MLRSYVKLAWGLRFGIVKKASESDMVGIVGIVCKQQRFSERKLLTTT